ncbi:MAG: 6-phosphogluconolactonase [Acidobacteriales bacterium]|nr:6-phosphogluconolactonase [Terriglobales bacterium]
MSESKPNIIVAANRDELNVVAAQFIARVAKDSIAARSRCIIALSGGSTPKLLYALLAQPEWSARFDWNRIHLFWSDERCVPIDHPDSNFAMVNKELLSKVPIPKENVHRYRTELGDASAVAADYEKTLREVFDVSADEVPRFDLTLLGLGENGHTASLFPHCPALRETERLVVADYVEEVKSWRLTFTARLINASRNIVFLISGASKAEVVRAVLNGPRKPEELPAQLINSSGDGEVTWIIDRAAAVLIQNTATAP